MKWQGYKQIALKSIIVDAPDIRKRMKAPHVVELANDIRAAGEQPIHAPTIFAPSNALLCGRDRFAALMILKAKRIWVHVADCSPGEADELELRENIYRRPVENRAELLAQLVALKEQEIRAREGGERGNTVTPSAQSVKAQARKEVARAAGVKPAAVKRAEQRAAAKDSAPGGHGPQGEPASAPAPVACETPAGGGNLPPKLPDGFDDLGLGMDQGEIERVNAATGLVAGWEKATTAILTQLTRQGGPLAAGHIQRIRTAGQALGHAIRDAAPVKRCLYCKGHAALVANCFACGQTGFMGRNDDGNAPAELRAAGKDARVAVNGAFVPYDGALDALKRAPAPKAAKPGAKRVSVQDEAGRDLTFVPDDGLAF
jgi:hypothetical protein